MVALAFAEECTAKQTTGYGIPVAGCHALATTKVALIHMHVLQYEHVPNRYDILKMQMPPLQRQRNNLSLYNLPKRSSSSL